MGDVIFHDFGGREVVLCKTEIANVLGVDVRTIERLTKQGMPSRIEGIRRMFKESECRNWLAQRERSAAHG